MAPERLPDAWESSITADFWQSLANLKLDTLRLSQRPLEIQGFFSPCSHPQIAKPLQLNYESLAKELNRSPVVGDRNQCPAPGTLLNTNTLDEFKGLDRKALLEAEAEKIWVDICSGRAEDDCKVLNRFFVTSHADLKEWKFTYVFSIPALKFPEPLRYTALQRASEYFTAEEHSSVVSACRTWRDSPSTTCVPCFLLHFSAEGVRARPLSDWAICQHDKYLLCFYDPFQKATSPGWPLRNLLMLAASRWKLRHATVLSWREMQGRADLRHCLVAEIQLPEVQGDKMPGAVACEHPPRIANLASMMDPNRLAKSAADLNLKLMKWRNFPTLNLDLLSRTKCLLLGAGILGCQVGRGLLAWGVRDITFVDCGIVNPSSSLTESLYLVEDSGRLKAEAASDALRNICTDVRSRSASLTIPMLGHPVLEDHVQAALDSFNQLKTLVDEHDIVFLLTDTRESRWLPTLICSAACSAKIVVNVALGFDSFVVMRHGDSPLPEAQNYRLGCYFCNDGRSDGQIQALHQKCPVTRPGLGSLAAALAVELAISILHHPLGVSAPADEALPVNSGTDQPLGILPHQIRGSLFEYSQTVITGPSLDSCTACSFKVASEFKRREFKLVLDAVNNPSYLEDLMKLPETPQLKQPFLNSERLSRTKCLLLGAGTLGCQVARSLLASGVRDITFVDYGKVGFSNPPRQSLYGLEDCIDCRPKAQAAANSLVKICTDVRARGEQLAIPMPGHPVVESQVQVTEQSFTRLKSLVEEHDVVFLLTDTRESRWLPTLLCSAADAPKIIVNAALGFDSFVVMRHGDGPLRKAQEPRLGCYFCNDVVAPADSTANRTLDQQCTVSRPGLACIAAGLAVELAVDTLHHPLGIAAPAGRASATDQQQTTQLPHQIRGFLSHYAQLAVTGYAFDGCTACSSKVVQEFRSRDFEFLLEAMNNPSYLEDLTGLTELLQATRSLSLDWDDEEEEKDDDADSIPEIP